MVGGREFHRVRPEFLKALEFIEVLLKFWEIRRGVFWYRREDNIIRFLIRSEILAMGERIY